MSCATAGRSGVVNAEVPWTAGIPFIYSNATKDFGVFKSADAAPNLSFPAHRKPGLFSCITVAHGRNVTEKWL
jgi:hypothetical protein